MSLKQGMFPDWGTVSHSAWEICAELTIRVPTFVLLSYLTVRPPRPLNEPPVTQLTRQPHPLPG